MAIRTIALTLFTVALAACVPNDQVETYDEIEETLDQDIDGDGQPMG